MIEIIEIIDLFQALISSHVPLTIFTGPIRSTTISSGMFLCTFVLSFEWFQLLTLSQGLIILYSAESIQLFPRHLHQHLHRIFNRNYH